MVNTTGSQIVNIPDENLRAVIEEDLGKESGVPITEAEMVTLTNLEAEDANITFLTGLEFATNLTSLSLGCKEDPWGNSNSVSDISALSGLTNLTVLNLRGNSV